MSYAELSQAVANRLSSEPGAQALFIAGSYGSGAEDAYSDLDLVVVADQDEHSRLAEAFRSALEQQAAVVFWRERKGRNRLVNAITEDWRRCDLFMASAIDFAQQTRSQDGLKVLFDRIKLYRGLPDKLPSATPDRTKVMYIVNEFLRVLGLMSVGLGRSEHVLLVKGAGLLRDLLTDLMLEESPQPDRGGALHLSRLLTPAQISLLEGLPYPAPNRDDVITAHVRTAAAFLPIARRLSQELEIVWPDAFERATRRRLALEGVTLDCA